MVESPHRYVREYELPQIPARVRVYDTPLSDEKADPIAVHDVLGSIIMYIGGVALATLLFVAELIASVLVGVLKSCRRLLLKSAESNETA